MKFFFSPTSPYARKVAVVALATGVHDRITRVPTNPHESGADLLATNPLSKIPCLVTTDGLALFDSPVICEYLDSIGSQLLYPTGAARWRALKQQALGDGIMDAAVGRRGEQARPSEPARDMVMERQRLAVSRAVDALEADVPADHLDIGTISVACALGYLDFRFAAEAWRQGHPQLTAWYAKMIERPEIAQTAPSK